jgi:hypothetical protein
MYCTLKYKLIHKFENSTEISMLQEARQTSLLNSSKSKLYLFVHSSFQLTCALLMTIVMISEASFGGHEQ